MNAIQFAHLKEFETIYKSKNSRETKFIKVTLQIVADSEHDYDIIRKDLANHIDKPLPRYLCINEQ